MKNIGSKEVIEVVSVNSKNQNIETSTNTETPIDAEKATAIDPVIQENTGNDTKDEPQTTDKKHIVTYVGNGTWRDKENVIWHKGHPNKDIVSEKVFSDAEYVTRNDIHFMVLYGSMKHTEV